MKRLLPWAKVHKIKALGILAAILVVASITVPNVRNVADTAIGHITTVSALGTADYALDGTDDNVQFQTALNALPATGGVLQCVSSGTIDWDAGVTVTRAIANVTIMGTGPGTYFDGDGVTPIFTAGGNNWNFMDFRTDAGSISFGATTGYSVKNVMVGTAYLQDRDGRGTYASASGAPDYVVGVNTATDDVPGSTGYWVKSGKTGQVIYSTSSATGFDLAFSAAVSALPSWGGQINLGSGNFTTGNTLVLPDKNIVVEGSGWRYSITGEGGTLIRTDALAGDMFATSDALHNITIQLRNFSIDCTNQTSGYGINLLGVQRIILDAIDLAYSYNDGIHINVDSGGHHPQFVWIENSHLRGNGRVGAAGDGMYLGNIYRATLIGNRVENSYGNNVFSEWSIELLMQGNVFDGYSSTNGQNGVLVDSADYLTFTGNMVHNSYRNGVYLTGVYWPVMTGNVIKDSSFVGANLLDGLYIAGSGRHVLKGIIANNDIGQREAANQRYGINLGTNIDRITVEGNDLSLNGTAGLFLTGVPTTSIIRGNMGYVTENSGTATLLNTQTSIVVNHGLSLAPVTITITWLEDPTNAIADWWIDTITATQFTLHGVDPGASNLDFRWTATAY